MVRQQMSVKLFFLIKILKCFVINKKQRVNKFNLFNILRTMYFAQPDQTTYSLLPSNFTTLRQTHQLQEDQLLTTNLTHYDNFMSTYQTLVHNQQQPQQHNNNTTNAQQQQVALSLEGLSERECTSCGQIFDFELPKDLRGCR